MFAESNKEINRLANVPHRKSCVLVNKDIKCSPFIYKVFQQRADGVSEWNGLQQDRHGAMSTVQPIFRTMLLGRTLRRRPLVGFVLYQFIYFLNYRFQQEFNMPINFPGFRLSSCLKRISLITASL